MEREMDSLESRIAEFEERLDYAYIAIMALNQMFIDKGFSTEDELQKLQQKIYEDSINIENEDT
ncbi:MAG TPA: hypothetical protein VJ824_16495 [Bacillota bacterium]|nr:hypothetical protein [Bacillota bacterium]